MATRLAQSVQRLAAGLMVRGWNPSVGEIIHNCPDRLWDQPDFLHSGCWICFFGGKAVGAWR
jgi:hypothetical protein